MRCVIGGRKVVWPSEPLFARPSGRLCLVLLWPAICVCMYTVKISADNLTTAIR